jgi:molybdopterin synthase catalytic subunit
MAQAWITEDPLDVNRLLSAVSGPGNGAVLLFLGVVRNRADGRPVAGMRYEAYEPMARAELSGIVEEAEERFDVSAVAAAHRLGELGLEEASLVITVSSPHRPAAYDASRWVLEEVKRRLPVWKHEHYTDGSSSWVAGTPLEPA